jgi:hypothetical protein
MRAEQIVKAMKKTRHQLQAEMAKVEKEMRLGWEEKLDTLHAEVEWFTRELGRREANHGKPQADTYQQLLSLLFVQNMTINPGEVPSSHPTPVHPPPSFSVSIRWRRVPTASIARKLEMQLTGAAGRRGGSGVSGGDGGGACE